MGRTELEPKHLNPTGTKFKLKPTFFVILLILLACLQTVRKSSLKFSLV